MRWSRFVISLLLLCCVVPSMADDSISIDGVKPSRYEQYVKKRYRYWDALIPRQFVVQNAGNMGILSVGTGWNYAHNHFETHLLFGYIPAHQSTRGKLTMTVKENYIPWNINISVPQHAPGSDLLQGWSIQPLTACVYLNTVFGHEFWKSQPHRYPSKYYEFMSTKFRLNVGLGQSITWQIPQNRRRYSQSVTLFYEFSSCDLYIRSKFLDHSVRLKDIVGLSVGLKLQTI